MSNFSALRGKLQTPFRGTFAGIVSEPKDMEESLTGRSRTEFDLVDNIGYYFRGCSIGRNASNNALFEGAYVVVYNGTRRPAFKDKTANFFLFQDAVIIQVAVWNGSVPKRIRLDVQ